MSKKNGEDVTTLQEKFGICIFLGADDTCAAFNTSLWCERTFYHQNCLGIIRQKIYKAFDKACEHNLERFGFVR